MVEEYNSTLMTGGDSLTEDLNVYYEVCLAVESRLRRRATNTFVSPEILLG